MTEKTASTTERYVVVTDETGNEYICPRRALRLKASLSRTELEACVAEGVTGGRTKPEAEHS